jgi:hypothetical protein
VTRASRVYGPGLLVGDMSQPRGGDDRALLGGLGRASPRCRSRYRRTRPPAPEANWADFLGAREARLGDVLEDIGTSRPARPVSVRKSVRRTRRRRERCRSGARSTVRRSMRRPVVGLRSNAICEITGPPPSNTVAGILHRSSRAHTQPLRSLIVVLSPTAQPTRFRTLSEVPVSPKQTARRSAGFDRIVRASSRARRTSGVRATNDCNARA